MPHIKYRLIVREDNLPSWRQRNNYQLSNAKMIYRMLYRIPDIIVCQSDDMMRDVIKTYKISSEKLVKINNPIDVKFIETQSARKIELGSNRINLLSAGRLEHQKGIDLLLKTMLNLKSSKYHLHIVGDGSMREDLEKYVNKHELKANVTFYGFRKNIYDYMKSADALILSSRYEGFPNVVLEAIACGCPVLAFRCKGGISEIISEGQNGFTVEAEDYCGLAKIIIENKYLKMDPFAIKSTILKKYDLRKILVQYETIFNR
jgi:glycosyltransferase involved in cell wall biosynthesis